MSVHTNLDLGDQYDNMGDKQAGSVAFAAILLIIVGLFHAIQGLVGILNDDFYVKTENYVFQMSTQTWGWIHMLLGILVLAAGAALFAGATWARTVAVIAATVSLIGNFAWLPHYPVWGLCLMALDVFIIWAVVAHGRDFAEE